MTTGQLKERLRKAVARNMAGITLTRRQVESLLQRLEGLEAFKDNIRLIEKHRGDRHAL